MLPITNNPLLFFLYGAIAFACFVVGLFFFKYYSKTGDQLLKQFGVAFWLMGAERVFLTVVPQESESRSMIFLLRLMAFALIIYGILKKNRTRG